MNVIGYRLFEVFKESISYVLLIMEFEVEYIDVLYCGNR